MKDALEYMVNKRKREGPNWIPAIVFLVVVLVSIPIGYGLYKFDNPGKGTVCEKHSSNK